MTMKTCAVTHEKLQRLLALGGLIILAALLRYRFLAKLTVSEFDPWRHLTLIDNIRSGAGFTLFDGQPYIWYNSIWYHLAAAFGPADKAAWLSAALAMLSLIVFFLFLLRSERSFVPALAGGLLLAAYGPLITFTGGYGSESLALLLVLLACLLATCRQSRTAVVAAGILFGMALLSRINFLFTVFLLLPLLTGRRSRILFLLAASLVIMSGWLHNQAVIGSHPYLFTWDGMATRSRDYTLFSTLVPQLHATVAAATRTLYEQVAPLPFDFFSRGPAAWGNVVFLLLGTGCVLATARIGLIAATLAPLVWFGLCDTTLSTNFFRHYLAIFPPLFIGIAIVCGRIRLATRDRGRLVRFSWTLVPLAAIISGLPYLQPQPMPSLEALTPPPQLLSGEYYMVNSGLYHPESLIRRYPGKHFIGMPLDPARFEEFARDYPHYTTIVWHRQFSVQDALLRYLTDSGGYRVVARASSQAGLEYLILERNSASAVHQRSR